MRQLHTRRVTLIATLLGLGIAAAAPNAGAQSDAHSMIVAAKAVEEATKEVMETLRVVVIPALTRDRVEMLGDLAGDTEQIQHVSHYLAGKLGDGISERHLQKSMHRISRDFKDLKFNAKMLAVPERVMRDVAKLGAAVQKLEKLYTDA